MMTGYCAKFRAWLSPAGCASTRKGDKWRGFLGGCHDCPGLVFEGGAEEASKEARADSAPSFDL